MRGGSEGESGASGEVNGSSNGINVPIQESDGVFAASSGSTPAINRESVMDCIALSGTPRDENVVSDLYSSPDSDKWSLDNIYGNSVSNRSTFFPTKNLPVELLPAVLKHLDFDSLLSAGATCRQWKELASQKLVVAGAFARRFKTPSHFPSTSFLELWTAEYRSRSKIYKSWSKGTGTAREYRLDNRWSESVSAHFEQDIVHSWDGRVGEVFLAQLLSGRKKTVVRGRPNLAVSALSGRYLVSSGPREFWITNLASGRDLGSFKQLLVQCKLDNSITCVALNEHVSSTTTVDVVVGDSGGRVGLWSALGTLLAAIDTRTSIHTVLLNFRTVVVALDEKDVMHIVKLLPDGSGVRSLDGVLSISQKSIPIAHLKERARALCGVEFPLERQTYGVATSAVVDYGSNRVLLNCISTLLVYDFATDELLGCLEVPGHTLGEVRLQNTPPGRLQTQNEGLAGDDARLCAIRVPDYGLLVWNVRGRLPKNIHAQSIVEDLHNEVQSFDFNGCVLVLGHRDKLQVYHIYELTLLRTVLKLKSQHYRRNGGIRLVQINPNPQISSGFAVLGDGLVYFFQYGDIAGTNGGNKKRASTAHRKDTKQKADEVNVREQLDDFNEEQEKQRAAEIEQDMLMRRYNGREESLEEAMRVALAISESQGMQIEHQTDRYGEEDLQQALALSMGENVHQRQEQDEEDYEAQLAAVLALSLEEQ